MSIRPSTRALVFALVFAAGAPVLAQEGGGGRILERDLRQGGSGNTPRASMYREVQMRNALVTGNVGGLGSFRGNVGYAAPNEFRGGLGSDNSYSFRRNAASAITQRSVRGGDALRYQMGNTVGSSYNSGTLISRSGPTGRSAAQAPIGSDGVASTQAFSGRTGYSPLNNSLRSTATFTSGQSLQPSVLNRRDATGGDRTTVGSSLLGMRELPTYGTPDDASTRRQTRPGEEPELRPGQVRSSVQALTQQAVTSAATPLVENLAPTASLTRTVLDELRDRQAKLASDRLAGRAAVGDGKEDGATQTSDPTTRTQRGDAWQDRVNELRKKLLSKEQQEMLAGGRMKSPLDQMKQTVAEKKKALDTILDDETVAVLREGAGQTRQFIAGGTDAYSEHMTKGQELMGEGRYFDAEERFTRALSAKEGDPTAMAGRLHAQLGAGLYLSAGINLRDLFSKNPEVIAMRYTGDTIPPTDRLVSIASDLRARITRVRDVGGAMSIDEGLLLAYIAWQVGDAGLVGEGLIAAEAADAQRQSFGEESDSLIEVMRKVWLPSTSPGAPTKAPTPAGTP